MGRRTRRFTYRLGVAVAVSVGGWSAYRRWQLRRGGVVSHTDTILSSQPMTRDAKLQQLRSGSSPENPFDVLIVGGGVTGLYTAVDAAQRGLRVAVVDADDFASGHSSTFPPLLPGAFPYVQRAIRQRDMQWLRRAADAWQARTIWENVAPDVISSEVCTLIPSARASELLEILSAAVVATLMSPFFGSWRSCSFVRGKQLQQEFADTEDKSIAAVVVRDTVVDGVVAAVSLARTAEVLGATALNYAPVVKVSDREACGTPLGKANFVATVRDTSDPRDAQGAASPEISVYTRSIVNCSGAWVDEVRQQLPAGPMGPTPAAIGRYQRTSYLVLPASAGWSDGRLRCWSGPSRALMASSTSYTFSSVAVLPWFDRCVLVGPTVAPLQRLPSRGFSGGMDRKDTAAVCPVFPHGDIDVCRAQCDHVWSALKASGVVLNKESVLSFISTIVPVLQEPSAVPWMSDVVLEGYHVASGNEHPHVIHVYGGSVGMSRLIAERTVDQLLKNSETFTAEEVKRFHPCRTRYLALVGGNTSLCAETDVNVASTPQERIRSFVREKYAVRLVDVVARRTRVAYSSPAEAISSLPVLAEVMRAELGWSPERVKAELDLARSFICGITTFA